MLSKPQKIAISGWANMTPPPLGEIGKFFSKFFQYFYYFDLKIPINNAKIEKKFQGVCQKLSMHFHVKFVRLASKLTIWRRGFSESPPYLERLSGPLYRIGLREGRGIWEDELSFNLLTLFYLGLFIWLFYLGGSYLPYP